MTPRDLKPLWTTWRCRSNANLFLLSLTGFLISLLVLGLIIRSGFAQHLLPVLPVVAVYFAIWTVKTWRRMRALRNARAECGPLSRDELRKARSKLVQNRKAV
jgi:hypothetical protein